MLSARAAAHLLSSAESIDGLIRLVRAFDFAGASVPLDGQAREALGLPCTVVSATLVTGRASLRALIVTSQEPDQRALLRRLATSLSAKAPRVLWLLITADEAGEQLAIGAPTLGQRAVTVAALVVTRGRVLESDAQTVRLLSAVGHDDDLATHARWVEVLGRDAISRRFFRALEQCIDRLARSADQGTADHRAEIALLYTSRLLFLAFLEAKGWLNGDPSFLARQFDHCMSASGGFHERVLLPLFFGTLNARMARRASRARGFGDIPFLNGGLFSRTPLERRARDLRFSDEAIGGLFGDLFGRYRFTGREETSAFEEAAIDPEMLGRAFECLMLPAARRATGAFYTPHELVVRVADAGLGEHLAARLGETAAEALLTGGPMPEGLRKAGRAAVAELRVLDPACGSGAFLVHVLQRVADLQAHCGDTRPAPVRRREVLVRSLFGVDVNPTAVWLCQLRLWLSIVIDSDENTRVDPLPNLDRNIRAGDSLAGSAFEPDLLLRGSELLRPLRERYARATGRRKASLARVLDREERSFLLRGAQAELTVISSRRKDLIAVRRGRDLFGGRHAATADERRQSAILRRQSMEVRRTIARARSGGALPFSFAAHFADVAQQGGFTLIVGNPPWIRPHRLAAHAREAYRERFGVARAAPWMPDAIASGSNRGFAAQVDVAALFVERSAKLLAPYGTVSFLLPTKLWRSLSGAGLRRFITDELALRRLEDYAEGPHAFDAAVYPGLLVARRRQHPECSPVQLLTMHRGRRPASWSCGITSLPFDESPGAPWIMLPPVVRRAFESVRDAGQPLAASRLGRPLLGVKCGFNDAFLVSIRSTDGDVVRVASANGREGSLSAEHLRPVLRGEDLGPWSRATDDRALVWTHGADGGPLRTLPLALSRWMAPHRRALLARADARSAARWWALFRTESAESRRARVVWADIGKAPRAAVLEAGDPTVPLNSCYVLPCASDDDAWALATLLNSSLVAAWLAAIAEPARGGYRRYLAWTMSLLPVPRHFDAKRSLLAELGRRAAAGDPSETLDAVIDAFDLSRRKVDPLLGWMSP